MEKKELKRIKHTHTHSHTVANEKHKMSTYRLKLLNKLRTDKDRQKAMMTHEGKGEGVKR